MTSLALLFSTYNEQIYGTYIHIKKTQRPKFYQVESILQAAGITNEDYALTTFADRIYVAQKVGFLPANVFLSKSSLNKYIDRLKHCAEVTAHPERDLLPMELDIGNITISLMLDNIPFDDGTLEYLAGVKPGYLKLLDRPIAQAEFILSNVYQTPIGTYKQIAHYRILQNVKRMESAI